MTPLTFAVALRVRLDAEGISAYELAERSGVSRQLIGKYLNDGTEPTFANVLRLAEALGCSANDLAYEVEGKRDEWLAAGVLAVWIVYPETRTVHAHQAAGGFAFLRESDTLTAPDLLPGFAVPVADLFRLPGPTT